MNLWCSSWTNLSVARTQRPRKHRIRVLKDLGCVSLTGFFVCESCAGVWRGHLTAAPGVSRNGGNLLAGRRCTCGFRHLGTSAGRMYPCVGRASRDELSFTASVFGGPSSSNRLDRAAPAAKWFLRPLPINPIEGACHVSSSVSFRHEESYTCERCSPGAG
jgi:hypothetical protein